MFPAVQTTLMNTEAQENSVEKPINQSAFPLAETRKKARAAPEAILALPQDHVLGGLQWLWESHENEGVQCRRQQRCPEIQPPALHQPVAGIGHLVLGGRSHCIRSGADDSGAVRQQQALLLAATFAGVAQPGRSLSPHVLICFLARSGEKNTFQIWEIQINVKYFIEIYTVLL